MLQQKMGSIIYITGGARSGKSSFAEKLLAHESDVLYIATAVPLDDEMRRRIALHRERRPASWTTLEATADFETVIPRHAKEKRALLVDCVTIMVTNLMLRHPSMSADTITPDDADAAEELVLREIRGLLTAARHFTGQTLIVSNETGLGIVPATPLGRHFRDIAGRANQLIATAADTAYLMVSGIPVKIKG
jgi:adenosylcobinamide kinase / adenosylcobinamide-phosphate guanylyltransferase